MRRGRSGIWCVAKRIVMRRGVGVDAELLAVESILAVSASLEGKNARASVVCRAVCGAAKTCCGMAAVAVSENRSGLISTRYQEVLRSWSRKRGTVS